MDAGVYALIGAIAGALITSGANFINARIQAKNTKYEKEIQNLRKSHIRAHECILLLLSKETQYAEELKKRGFRGTILGIRRIFTRMAKEKNNSLATYETIAPDEARKLLREIKDKLLNT